MITSSREEELKFLKALLSGTAVICPKCGKAKLNHAYHGVRVSNTEYICPACGEHFKTWEMTDALIADRKPKS